MKVLQLSTYPIEEPRHGGQIRVNEIRQKFISLNCEVLSLSISEPSHSKYNSHNDFILNMRNLPMPKEVPFCSDLATARLALPESIVFKFLLNHLLKFQPDIIMCEQVWLWPFIRLFNQLKIINRDDYYLVYSSQNIESEVKKSILERHGIGSSKDGIIKEIAALEEDLVKNADKTICVTKTDADFFHSYDSKSILICPNGVSMRQSLANEINIIKHLVSNRPYLFFCGSAYPPNAQGFWDMFGPSMANFPPECMIIVAGGVGDILWNYMPTEAKKYSQVNQSIVKCVGMLSNEMLTAFINEAKGIILPITFGGGSNLKTAEAISSCKPVIATTTACRGFDFVDQLSNFYITDDKQYFSNISRDILLDNIKTEIIPDKESQLRQSVYWDVTLARLEEITHEARRKLYK